jgi:DNA topoisomerase-1
MDRIQSGNEKRDNIILEAVKRLKPVLTEWKQQEKIIGEELSNAIKKAKLQERVIGECPSCHTGKLMILYSRKTRKRFIGCTNYFKNACKMSFPLPQYGATRPTGKICKGCGWPLLLVYIKGKRPWNLCFNPNCPKKEERRKRFEMQSVQPRSTSPSTQSILRTP